MPNNLNTRRSFIKKTAATSAAALAAPTFIPASALGKDGTTAPSNRVTLGLIGCGGQGMGDLNRMIGYEDAQALAVCDVDGERVASAVNRVNDKQKSNDVTPYANFQDLVDRKDIDAVVVGTPDHWHGLTGIAAINAGKDVYGEKPITHTFHEGQKLYKAAQKRGAIWQTGSQQRSTFNFRWACELVRNGFIGKVHRVEVGLPTGHDHPKVTPVEKDPKRANARKYAAQDILPSTPPADLDYNLYCGPSKLIPYIKARMHFSWRWNLNFGGGQLMDWIGHHNDIAHWGIDADYSGPTSVEAKGFTYPSDTSVYDAAIDYEVVSQYANDITISMSNKHTMGTKWYGENDQWVYVTRGKFTASNMDWTATKFDRGPIKLYESIDHKRNFIDCVKSRKPTICPAELSHRSATPGHLGLISQAVGRPIKWDPKKEKIIGDKEATKLLTPPMREPWTM